MSCITVVCPACKGDLRATENDATCGACGRSYPAIDGGYDLRFEGASSPDRARWAEAQELGSRSYLADPASNCSRWLGHGRYARAFGHFCRLHGRVLDVGCGPYGPSVLDGSAPETELVGVDPLPAAGRFATTYRAMAENLPFRAGTFDHVIMVSSLDHVLDPIASLAEARRVLRPGGRLHVWTHVHPSRARRSRELAHAALRRLFEPLRWRSIPVSARFAFRHLRRDQDEPDEHHLRLLPPEAVRRLLEATGFSVDRQMSCEGHIFFLSGEASSSLPRSGANSTGVEGAV